MPRNNKPDKKKDEVFARFNYHEKVTNAKPGDMCKDTNVLYLRTSSDEWVKL